MFPSFKIGSLVIEMYYVMIVIGVIIGLVISYFTVYKKEKLDKNTTISLIACFAFGGAFLYLGAFLFDSLFHSIEEGKFVYGGITWLGGVVVSFPLTILLIHFLVPKYKDNPIYIFSLILPSIVIAHGFGRIGCFFEGCCYGKVTTSFFGVKFPGLSEKVLPTQLFEAIFEFLLGILMIVFNKKIKGQHLTIYLLSYGVFRFILEFYRGDDRGSIKMGISPSQLLDIVIVIIGVILLIRYFKTKKDVEQNIIK